MPRRARSRLAALPAIEAATIRKIYPGKVIVTIDEKVPVARWRVGGVTYLVDDAGQADRASTAATIRELPLVVGEGANDDALIMLKSMERYDRRQEGPRGAVAASATGAGTSSTTPAFACSCPRTAWRRRSTQLDDVPAAATRCSTAT